MKLTKKRKIAMLLIPAIAAGAMMMTNIVSPVGHAYADQTTDSAANSSSSSSSSASSDGGSTAASGSYSSLQPNAILATAYHDGYGLAVGADQTDAKSAAKALNTFTGNINKIINVQTNNHQTTFGAVGTLIGPIGLSGGSSTNALAATTSVNKDFLTKKLSGSINSDGTVNASTSGLGMQYYKFGMAYQELIKTAKTVSPSSMSGISASTGLGAISGTVAKLGVTVLNDFSPAPVILSLIDSSKLNSPTYRDNKLVGVINDTPVAKQAVSFLGDTVPGTNLPMSIMIMLSCVLVSLGLNLLLVFFNGRNFGMSFRKMISRVVIVSVAIPLAAEIYDFGLNAVGDEASSRATSTSEQVVSTNLDVADWAKSACFGLPNNMSLHTDDGQFVFSNADIKAINMYSAYQAGVISNGEYNNGSVSEATTNKVASYLSGSVGNNNETSIGWRDTIRQDGKPYYTDKLNKLANSLGQNQEIKTSASNGTDAKDVVSPNDIGYISYESLYSTDGGKTFTMDSSGSPYGLSPVAAYNLVGSTFSQDGIKVNSNINNPTAPTVAIGADTYGAATNQGSNKPKMNPLLAGIINIVLLFAGFSALARIIAAGFGGMFRGGAGASVGSAAGAGELLGGIVALIGGVLGLSILIVFVQSVMDFIYGTIYSAMDGALGDLPFLKGFKSLGDTLRKIPLIGSTLAAMTDGVFHFVDTIVCLIAFPKLVRIPIDAFGNWIAGIPDYISEKAAAMEGRFTGDYRSGGMHSTGALRQAAAKQGAKLNAQKQAGKAGMAMLAGAGIKSILDKKDSMKDSKDQENKSEDTKGDDTKEKDKDASSTLSANDSKSVAEKGGDKSSESAQDTDESVANNDTSEVDSAAADEAAAADAGAVDGTDESVAGDESPDGMENPTGDETVNGESSVAGSENPTGEQAANGDEESVTNEAPVDDSDALSEESVAGDESSSIDQDGDILGAASDGNGDESVASDPTTADQGATDADSVTGKQADGEAANDANAQTGNIADTADDKSVAGDATGTESQDTGDTDTGAESTPEAASGQESVAGAAGTAAAAAKGAAEAKGLSDVKNINSSNTGDSVSTDNSKDGDSRSSAISTKGGDESVSHESNQEGTAVANNSESTKASAEVSQDAQTMVQPGTAGDTASVSNTQIDNSARTSANTASSTQSSTHQVGAAAPKDSATRLGGNAGASTGATDQTAQAVSTKANSFMQKISGAGRAATSAVNNSVTQNILGTSTGNVSAREQAAMGAAHVAAAMVGAQGLTQKGVDQINRRKGTNVRPNTSSSPSHSTSSPSAHTVNDAAEAMEQRDRTQDVNRQRSGTASSRNFIRSIRNN